MMQKILLTNFLSPGDIVVMTAAIRDLKRAYPSDFVIDVTTACDRLFDFNPFITKFNHADADVWRIRPEYPLIHRVGKVPCHFLDGYAQDLGQQLGRPFPLTEFKGDVYLSDEEKGWISQVEEITGDKRPYIIVNAGSKNDFTAKQYSRARYQQVVDECKDLTFVQVGEADHNHTPLTGDNVINLLGKTDVRQFVRLMYHAWMVITPSSFAMHLSAAVPPPQGGVRPCIVIGGGRENVTWQLLPGHIYLGQNAGLKCATPNGCWKSRVVPLDDGDDEKNSSLCERPVDDGAGQIIPACLEQISVYDIVRAIRSVEI